MPQLPKRPAQISSISLLLLLLSCVGKCGFIPPETGVTEQFYQATGNEIVSLAQYDFSKLGKDCGLFVFSYDFEYQDVVKAKHPEGEGGKRGIRVWEYRFTPYEWDIKRAEVKHQFWRMPDESTGGLTSHGWALTIRHEYRKGRIVYGGRLGVDFDTFFESGPEVTFAFDEDMGDWLAAHSDALKGIKIDTVLMTAGY